MFADLQTLHNALNKLFKNPLRTEINDYTENKMKRNQRENLKFVKKFLPG